LEFRRVLFRSFDQQATATFQQTPGDEPDGHDAPADDLRDTGELPSVSLLDDQEEIAPASALRVAPRSGSRSRRRTPPKRSALLTVAVPSMCVMGVAGIAAASVGDLSGDSRSEEHTSELSHVKISYAVFCLK